MFERDPELGRVGIVARANLWKPAGEASFAAMVYDDHRHKYLWEITKAKTGLETEGDDASPEMLGLQIADYLECGEPPEAEPIIADAPVADVQILKDGLKFAAVFGGGDSPGLLDAPDLHGVDILDVKVDHAVEVHQAAEGMMAENIGYDDGDEEDGTFRVRMASLYHPFARTLVHRLSQHGLPGLYDTDNEPGMMRQLATGTPLDSDGPRHPSGVHLGRGSDRRVRLRVRQHQRHLQLGAVLPRTGADRRQADQ